MGAFLGKFLKQGMLMAFNHLSLKQHDKDIRSPEGMQFHRSLSFGISASCASLRGSFKVQHCLEQK
jgi:hypothetical protein